MLTLASRYKYPELYSALNFVPGLDPLSSEAYLRESNLHHDYSPALWFVIKVGLAMFGSFVLLFRVFTSLFPSVRKTAKTKQMILEAINFANSNAVSEKMKYTKKKVQETCQGKSWSACGGKQCQYNYKNQTCHPSKEALARSMFVKEKRKK